MSSGSGASRDSRAPVTGCVEGEHGGVESGARKRGDGRPRRGAPTPTARACRRRSRRRRRDGRGRRGGRGSGACARCGCAPAAAPRRPAPPRPRRSSAPARPRGARDGHLLALDGIAADGRVDGPARAAGARRARRPGTASPPRATANCAASPRCASSSLRDHHQAGGPAVQPVDDARAQDAADAREVADVVEERVHQRARRRARARVDDQARRLVHHQQMGVLVHDGEGDVLGPGTGGRRLGHRRPRPRWPARTPRRRARRTRRPR